MAYVTADRAGGATPSARPAAFYLNGFAKSKMIAMTSV